MIVGLGIASYGQSFVEIETKLLDQILLECSGNKEKVRTLKEINEVQSNIEKNLLSKIDLQSQSLYARDTIILSQRKVIKDLSELATEEGKKRKKAKFWNRLLGFVAGGALGFGVGQLIN